MTQPNHGVVVHFNHIELNIQCCFIKQTKNTAYPALLTNTLIGSCLVSTEIFYFSRGTRDRQVGRENKRLSTLLFALISWATSLSASPRWQQV